MRVIALYLPQYHEIPENDLWWGKGYTEWTSVKRGQVLIDGQYQPRIPLNGNYYDLLDIDVMKWQTKIAKEHGIYGFCFYHYWFNGKKLLEKPIEQYLLHQEIDFPFYLCWANETWTTVWEGEENPTVLAEHDYTDVADVDKHFQYWLPFFKDKRYIKDHNRPVLNIYNPIVIPYRRLKYMINRWNELAKKEGFDGISFQYLCAESMCFMDEKYKDLFEYGVEYEPSYVQHLEDDIEKEQKRYKRERLSKTLNKHFPFLFRVKHLIRRDNHVRKETELTGVKILRDYDKDWEKVLNITHYDYSKYIPGGFIDWDNTPRRGHGGKVILGANPQKFEKYFERLVLRTKEVYKKDMIVLFAWNEWSEGGYLEPDEKWGTAYLQAIKNVLEKLGETPYRGNECGENRLSNTP